MTLQYKVTVVESGEGKEKRFKLLLGQIMPIDPKAALLPGAHELGESKTDFDARFHMHALNNALQAEYDRGRRGSYHETGTPG